MEGRARPCESQARRGERREWDQCEGAEDGDRRNREGRGSGGWKAERERGQRAASRPGAEAKAGCTAPGLLICSSPSSQCGVRIAIPALVTI